jgi:hypothetical protein
MYRSFCSGNTYYPVFQRLTQSLQYIDSKFWSFIKEKYTKVGKAYFSRARDSTAAKDTLCAG